MNICKKIQLVSAVVMASMTVASAQQIRPEFVKTNQSFVFFNVVKGAKYPGMIKCVPAINRLEVILCGCEKDGSFGRVKAAQDLEFLAPLRYTTKFADSGLQIDKKLEGYREAYVGIMVEALLKASHLMPADGYKGDLLVEEYLAGMPMKWAVSSIEEFRGVKGYLIKKFMEYNVAAPAKKPLLLVEFLDGNPAYDDTDKEFLNTFFDVLDPLDPAVKAFFDQCQKSFGDMLDKTKDAKNTGESIGELLMRNMESVSGDFEGKKVVAIVLGAVVGGIVVAKLTKMACGKLDKWFDKGLEAIHVKNPEDPNRAPMNHGDAVDIVNAINASHN
jgi:hypothetical protein